MFTYLIANIFFLYILFILFYKKYKKHHLYALLVLLVMTAIFDQIIIGLGIVDYDVNKILGLYIGFAPIEDFFYCVGAVIIVSAIWQKQIKN